MSAHSRLAPSAAGRWVFCPGSVALSEEFPQLIENDSAPEGVAAHWVVSSMLTTHAPLVGEIAPNGIAVTEEMIDGALLYYNFVFKLANPHGGLKVRFRWEEPEVMPSIHPEMWGTPDGAGLLDIVELTGELHITDYKFGHGEVSPVENWQLASYARGVLDRMQFDGHAEQHIRIHLHIVQPRCYTSAGPIRSWSCTAADMRAMWNKLHDAGHEALSPNPRFRVGDHCRYCPGRRACAELKRQSAWIQDYAEYQQPIELPVGALGLELAFVERSLAMLEARATGLREQTEANIRAGQSVPGWGMAPGQSRTTWNVPVSEVHALGEAMGVDLRKEAAPTPKQAEQIFKKAGIDASIIEAYSSTNPGGLKLVPAAQTLAKKAFGA